MPKQVTDNTSITMVFPLGVVKQIADVLQAAPFRIASPILNDLQKQLDAQLADDPVEAPAAEPTA